MRVLFATAELRPLVSAGGLGEAAAGLTAALRESGVEVVTAVPDYQRWTLDGEEPLELAVPDWAAPASARVGSHLDTGPIALVDVPGIERSDPYVDGSGEGWADNDLRFGAFSAAVSALSRAVGADVVHLNDWHTALAPAFLADDAPTVLTIHNLGHQGWAGSHWLHRLPRHREAYAWGDSINALGGAIRVVDRLLAVSPHYATEIITPEGGMGLDEALASRGAALRGILNGIDTRVWDPRTDAHAPRFDSDDLEGKAVARQALLDHVGWTDTGDPLIVMVTRLVEQKGVDLAFEAARFLEGMRARLIVLGSGEARLAAWGRWLAESQPERVWFHEGYDAPVSHLLFAGGDVLLMPSRFEPCGLAQMQAMAYGTIPVVTPVGGLVDTVADADRDAAGTGFVATTTDESGVVDALHRALRAVRHHGRRRALQRRGMSRDWSWRGPAKQVVEVYGELAKGSPR
ncbi:MAG: glycogen/starch synthase [Acidimicrobiia bacterium]|nr:glycogen/starch synthase [Acidimicrobiia bacterium]